jgi:glycerate 2-kinase
MAENAGFSCEIMTNSLQGDAVTAGKYLGEIIKKVQQNQYHIERPACLIAGGETTVVVKGNGIGGRNQEVALSASMVIDGIPNAYLITLATDGEDGPTDATGAIVSGKTVSEAKVLGLNPKEYLDNNDSYNFFKKLGCLMYTGSTGTNVNDINFIFML